MMSQAPPRATAVTRPAGARQQNSRQQNSRQQDSRVSCKASSMLRKEVVTRRGVGAGLVLSLGLGLGLPGRAGAKELSKAELEEKLGEVEVLEDEMEYRLDQQFIKDEAIVKGKKDKVEAEAGSIKTRYELKLEEREAALLAAEKSNAKPEELAKLKAEIEETRTRLNEAIENLALRKSIVEDKLGREEIVATAKYKGSRQQVNKTAEAVTARLKKELEEAK